MGYHMGVLSTSTCEFQLFLCNSLLFNGMCDKNDSINVRCISLNDTVKSSVMLQSKAVLFFDSDSKTVISKRLFKYSKLLIGRKLFYELWNSTINCLCINLNRLHLVEA